MLFDAGTVAEFLPKTSHEWSTFTA